MSWLFRFCLLLPFQSAGGEEEGVSVERRRTRLTVHRVEFDAVGRGRPVRRPLDAELVVVDVVGLNVGHVQVDCRGHKFTFQQITHDKRQFQVCTT